MSDSTGRFSEVAMTEAIHQIARHVGADASDAALLRLTNNAVFALPSAGIVIRITRSHQLHDRVHKVARLAEWFASIDAPTIRLAPGVEQPVRCGDLLATLWQYLPSTSPELTAADLGVVLREFHALPPSPFPLPVWDPVGDVRRRLADADGLDADDRQYLTAWADRLAADIEAINQRPGHGLLHADAHVGNLLRQDNGRVVLCDFDPTCVGPWQVDLVAVAVGEARFGRPGAHNALAAAYGSDVTDDPDWPLFRQARELKMVAAAVPLLTSAPGVAAEFRCRLRSIQDHDDHARWTPFADLRT